MYFGVGLIDAAQRNLERRHRRARRALEREDERLGDLLAFSGGGE